MSAEPNREQGKWHFELFIIVRDDRSISCSRADSIPTYIPTQLHSNYIPNYIIVVVAAAVDVAAVVVALDLQSSSQGPHQPAIHMD